jgi:hypothetical protein|tara:strand:+ start:414 stop:602 length:189 start_codon:yes stop_codon:yes gene_type:complete
METLYFTIINWSQGIYGEIFDESGKTVSQTKLCNTTDRARELINNFADCYDCNLIERNLIGK